jgi:hypothetical protein
MLAVENYDWLKHFWPFHHPAAGAPLPDGGLVDGVKKAIEQAAELAYWSGAGHGFLAAIILCAVIGLIWWLFAKTMDRGARATIIVGLVAVALWYASSLQNKATPIPIPNPPKNPTPKPVPDPRPRRPHFTSEENQ